MYDRTTVRPYDRTTVRPYDRVTVRPCDHTTVRPYDRATVQSATFNMRGQLYRGHVNDTALPSSPMVSALGSESDDPGSSPGRGKALWPWDVRGKKDASSAFRLG